MAPGSLIMCPCATACSYCQSCNEAVHVWPPAPNKNCQRSLSVRLELSQTPKADSLDGQGPWTYSITYSCHFTAGGNSAETAESAERWVLSSRVASILTRKSCGNGARVALPPTLIYCLGRLGHLFGFSAPEGFAVKIYNTASRGRELNSSVNDRVLKACGDD